MYGEFYIEKEMLVFIRNLFSSAANNFSTIVVFVFKLLFKHKLFITNWTIKIDWNLFELHKTFSKVW